MIYGNYKKDDGFLLIDNLASLTILLVIIAILIPLMIDWLGFYTEAKEKVEENRQLYEQSMEIKNNHYHSAMGNEEIKLLNNKKRTSEMKVLAIEITEISFD